MGRACGCFALALLLAAPLGASDVAAGIDLWITPEDNFETAARILIPAGFFGTSSDAVHTNRIFHGQPLITDSDYPSLAPADTVLERLETAHLTVCGDPVTVPLRIAALHLEAVGPLTVTYNGGGSPENWRIEIFLSKAAQENGALELSQNCNDGGTLLSTIKVRPRFVFTRLSDNFQLALDWNTYPKFAREISLSAFGHWARSAPTGYPRTEVEAGARVDASGDGDWQTLPATTADFVVGIKATPCTCAQSAEAAAKVDPDVIFEQAALLEQFLRNLHRVFLASCDSRALPARAPEPPATTPGRRPDPLARAVRVAPIGLLALAAGTALPWRRRRKKPADRG